LMKKQKDPQRAKTNAVQKSLATLRMREDREMLLAITRGGGEGKGRKLTQKGKGGGPAKRSQKTQQVAERRRRRNEAKNGPGDRQKRKKRGRLEGKREKKDTAESVKANPEAI